MTRILPNCLGISICAESLVFAAVAFVTITRLKIKFNSRPVFIIYFGKRMGIREALSY